MHAVRAHQFVHPRSGNNVRSCGSSPALLAAVTSCEISVPASQYRCRQPRSAYFCPVRHGTPVTTSVVASPIAGGPTWRSACSTGSYQCTPSGTPSTPFVLA